MSGIQRIKRIYSEAAELEEYASQLIERENEHLRTLLSKNNQKQQKLQTMEQRMMEEYERKAKQFNSKMQRSCQKRDTELKKIIKKCQDHDKLVSRKQSEHASRRKASMRQAWAKAQQFNKDIYSYLNKTDHQPLSPKGAFSRSLHQDISKDNTPINKSKLPQKLNQSMTLINGKRANDFESYGRRIPTQSVNIEQTPMLMTPTRTQQNQQKSNKLYSTLAKFKLLQNGEESRKIQTLGEHLRKIDQTRIKRQFMLQKSRKGLVKSSSNEEIARSAKKASVKRPKKPETAVTSSAVKDRSLHDWSEKNKQRRERLLKQTIQDGYQYLEKERLLKIKNRLSRSILSSSIEKKLYLERQSNL